MNTCSYCGRRTTRRDGYTAADVLCATCFRTVEARPQWDVVERWQDSDRVRVVRTFGHEDAAWKHALWLTKGQAGGGNYYTVVPTSR